MGLYSHKVRRVVTVHVPLNLCLTIMFMSIVITAVNPDGDLITLNGYLLVNNLCGLVGYYCAAKVIDMPSVGRKKLQCFSFMLCGIIFLTAGAIFNKTSPQVLMFLYFFSSFVVNFGPNVTTYVMAAETYPTELRGTCHGSKSKWLFFLFRQTCPFLTVNDLQSRRSWERLALWSLQSFFIL